MEQDRRRGHAIVIGGSVVGSTVGALLARRFERVTILERDTLPSDPSSRAGVPQSRHVHALLARGAAELERTFPGFLNDMVARGAQLVDVGREVAWLTGPGWGVPFESGIRLCCATRDLIEWQVRRRALEQSNVTLIDKAAVTGLVTDASGERVLGVKLRDRGCESVGAQREMTAELIVDTTGRASQLPEWLGTIGRPVVRETVIDAGMAYASRFYAVPAGALGRWRAAYVQAALPEHTRGGILFPVEGGRFHLTLLGYADSAPATDEAGFRAFMERLRSPILADILQHAMPLTPIVGHRRTENRWRHFEEIQGWPDGLIALGDSICCFDPVYGQGMSTGILSAQALAARIDSAWTERTAPVGFARRVQQDLVAVVRPAWNLATGEDLRLPSTTGGQLRRIDRVLQQYIDTVIAAATVDPSVRSRLLSVMNMLAGPETLLHPRTLARVVRFLYAGGSRTSLWREWSPAAEAGARSVPAVGFTATCTTPQAAGEGR